MSNLYIITGPAGVGKSTISKIIASDIKKSALIEGDDIYHLVVGGYVSPWLENNHLEVFWENCLSLIDNFLKKDYDVVFNYIIDEKDLEKIKTRFTNHKIKFIVLLVDEETIIKRDNLRPIDCRMGERSIILLDSFKRKNFDKKYLLDTTNLTVDQTIEAIKDDRFNIN